MEKNITAIELLRKLFEIPNEIDDFQMVIFIFKDLNRYFVYSNPEVSNLEDFKPTNFFGL